MQADVERTLNGVEQRHFAGGVAIGPLEPTLLRPASVAVHDNRDVLGESVQVEVHHARGTYRDIRRARRSTEASPRNFNIRPARRGSCQPPAVVVVAPPPPASAAASAASIVWVSPVAWSVPTIPASRWPGMAQKKP